jgi:hypothetical protein
MRQCRSPVKNKVRQQRTLLTDWSCYRKIGTATLMNDLAKALRLLRVFHDISQTELADRLEVSKSFLSEHATRRRADRDTPDSTDHSGSHASNVHPPRYPRVGPIEPRGPVTSAPGQPCRSGLGYEACTAFWYSAAGVPTAVPASRPSCSPVIMACAAFLDGTGWHMLPGRQGKVTIFLSKIPFDPSPESLLQRVTDFSLPSRSATSSHVYP